MTHQSLLDCLGVRNGVTAQVTYRPKLRCSDRLSAASLNDHKDARSASTQCPQKAPTLPSQKRRPISNRRNGLLVSGQGRHEQHRRLPAKECMPDRILLFMERFNTICSLRLSGYATSCPRHQIHGRRPELPYLDEAAHRSPLPNAL